jgi:hypothetical protein
MNLPRRWQSGVRDELASRRVAGNEPDTGIEMTLSGAGMRSLPS